MNYTANGGQTYMPFRENIHIPTLPYTPLSKPEPALPVLSLNSMAQGRGWVINSQHQHFLPGVTAQMMDWWWANMEKGYYLWAPGSHKRFSWVREPWKYGFVHSAHMISEAVGEGVPVFGGNGVQINRLDMDWFPFTTALEHVIVEGVFNGKDEFVDMTVHQWQDVPGGCVHMDAAVANPDVSEPPQFILEMLAEDPEAKPVAPSSTDHGEYEASRWPVFLPKLWELWKDHPDPSQSVPCDLRVEATGKETWRYVCTNGPVTREA
jgi:nitroreductase